MTAIDTRLIALEVQRDALIRSEVVAGRERARLEKAVRQAVRTLGASTDEVSAATGLTPTEIARILEHTPSCDELDELLGVAC